MEQNSVLLKLTWLGCSLWIIYLLVTKCETFLDKAKTMQQFTEAALKQRALSDYIMTYEERRPADLRSENVLT